MQDSPVVSLETVLSVVAVLWECYHTATLLFCHQLQHCHYWQPGLWWGGREGGREGGTSSLLTSTVHTSHYTLPTPGNTGHHRRSSGSNTRKQTNNQSSPIGLSQGVVWRLRVWLQVAGYQSCFTQIFKLFCCGTTELWLAVTPWYLSQPICTLLSLIKLLYNLSLFGFGRIIRGSTFRSKYQSVSHLDGFCQIQDSRQSDGVFLFNLIVSWSENYIRGTRQL